MATYNYRPENISATHNGRRTTQFGKSDNGIEIETDDDKHVVTRLLNGDVLITGRVSEGVSQTLNLARGSADAQFFQDCYDNAVVINSIINVMSDISSEKIICLDGIVTKIGTLDYMGSDVSDVVFTLVFGNVKIMHNSAL